jgi:hypothetical protein
LKSAEKQKSLSIKNPNNDDPNARPIKLKGAIYEQDFRLTEESERLTIAASERYRREAEQRNQSNIQRYAEYSAKRSTELEQQYRQHQSGYTAETERSNERDIAADQQDDSSNQTTAAAGHERSIAITTTADQAAPSELAAIERLEPRNSPSSQIKENPYFIEYSLDFTGMYNAYQQHLFWLRQQEQVQRHHRDGEQSRVSKIAGREHEYPEVRNGERLALVRSDRPDREAIQQQHASSEGNKLNESRSAVIENHRRTTASIEATTARTRESTATYSIAITDNRAVKELHENFTREAQRSRNDSEEISADGASAIRADHFSTFFDQTARDLRVSTARATERVSDQFESRFRSETTDPQRATDFSSDRDRKAVETDVREDYRENAFSRAVSTKLAELIQRYPQGFR